VDSRRPLAGQRLSTVLLWTFLLATYLYPQFLFPIHNPNERARSYMTVAMVEHGTFAIGYRKQAKQGRGFVDQGSVYDRWGYVNDKALVCDDPSLEPPDCAGTLYSAKAPGTSFLGYPIYAVLKLLADAVGQPLSQESILLVLRLFCVVIPSLLMLAAFRRFASEVGFDPVLSDLATAGLGVGSMVYTYSHMFAGHQVTAYLLFFSLLTAWRSRTDDRPLWPAASGFLLAAAVSTEYPMLLVALALFAWQWYCRPKASTLAWAILGGLLPVVLTAWFHASAFGRPWRTAYSTLENPGFVRDIAPGIMGLREPRAENLIGAFVAPFEGMFFYAPWMALCIPAMLLYPLRHRRSQPAPMRGLFYTGTAALLALTLFIACHSLWRGGWTLGPRYIVPFAPFAALVILHWAHLWSRTWPLLARLVVAALVLVSVVVTGACSLVSQGFHTAFFNPLTEAVLPLLREGFITCNLGHVVGLNGGWSAIPLLVLAVPAMAWLAWCATRSPACSPAADGHRFSTRLFLFSLVFLATAAGLLALLVPSRPMTLKKIKALTFTQDNFYPFGITNEFLDARAFRHQVGNLLQDHPEAARVLQAELLSAGDCRKTLGKVGHLVQTDLDASVSRNLVPWLSTLLPSPTPLVVPLTLRPEFRIPESPLKRR